MALPAGPRRVARCGGKAADRPLRRHRLHRALVAERLVAQGARPVLAGRPRPRLAGSRSLGGLETVHADVMRQNSVFDLVGSGDVLVSTVGPFAKWGQPRCAAAIAAGGTYLDSTGEPAFIRRVFEEFAPPARRCGRDAAARDGLRLGARRAGGALALEDARRRTRCASTSATTRSAAARTSAARARKESLVGAMLDPAFAFRDGRLITERGGARARYFASPGAAGRRCRSAPPSTSRCRPRSRSCVRSTRTSGGSARCAAAAAGRIAASVRSSGASRARRPRCG